MSFQYAGALHSSKSLVNRYLILQQAFSDLKISYKSDSEDVLFMESLFEKFKSGEKQFDVGEGGTTFRFFSFWISQQQGDWILKLGPQLSRRPHAEISEILDQVGVKSEFLSSDIFKIYGKPWALDQDVTLDLKNSTQFFTGFILAAAGSLSTIKVNVLNPELASGYEVITLKILKDLDFEIQKEESKNSLRYQILPPQNISKSIEVGADWSSIFYLALFAFSGAQIQILNADSDSPEPDLQGLCILRDCGLDALIEDRKLIVKTSQILLKKEIFDFRKNPDLFPGFCGLLIALVKSQDSTHDSVTLLYPAQLQIKESDRLARSLELFDRFGVLYKKVKDGELWVDLKNQVSGDSTAKALATLGPTFNTDYDHRMLMTVMFLRSTGLSITPTEYESHSKSFPEFMEIING